MNRIDAEATVAGIVIIAAIFGAGILIGMALMWIAG
jgi:hypothetical protein